MAHAFHTRSLHHCQHRLHALSRDQSLHEQTNRHFGDRSTREGRHRGQGEKSPRPLQIPKRTPCVQSCMATAAMRLHHLLLQHPSAFCPVLAAQLPSGIGLSCLSLWELAICLHDSKLLAAEILARRGIAAPSPPKSQKYFGPPVAPLNNSRSNANRQGEKRNSHRLLRGIVQLHFHSPMRDMHLVMLPAERLSTIFGCVPSTDASFAAAVKKVQRVTANANSPFVGGCP